MLILFIAIAGVVYFVSLLAHKKVRTKSATNKIFQWVAWSAFCLWTLGFILCSMSVIQNNFAEANKVIAIIPIILAFIAFLVIYRKELALGSFERK